MTTTKDQGLLEKFTRYYDGKDAARELALKLARELSKESSIIIRKLHNKNTNDLTQLLPELNALKSKYEALNSSMSAYPELLHSNMVENNVQEYAEAIIMLTLIKNKLEISKLPDPDKLDLPYTAYLLGLCDVIGEFRRCTLDALRNKDVQNAGKYLDTMEQLYELVINLNYPDRVLPLRRKQDVARALIEKTRSELVFAVSEYGLVENITDLKRDLKNYYKKNIRKD